MSMSKVLRPLICLTVGLVLILIGCGKDLSQVFFHVPVEIRAVQSLSGTLSQPSSITVANPNSFRFAVFGDIQIRDEDKSFLTQLQADSVSKQIDFFVVLGDLTEDGTISQFQKVKTNLDQVGIPYYVTIGNHDLFQKADKGGWDHWKQTFGPATYSVTVANAVRFIFLDSSSGEIGPTQFTWLENQLKTQAPYTFVGTHYPIYDGLGPVIWRLESVEERYKLSSLLNRYGVYAYISGHVHGYRSAMVGRVQHYTIGSMYPYQLDYGKHGYVLFSYSSGTMQNEWVEVPATP